MWEDIDLFSLFKDKALICPKNIIWHHLNVALAVVGLNSKIIQYLFSISRLSCQCDLEIENQEILSNLFDGVLLAFTY